VASGSEGERSTIVACSGIGMRSTQVASGSERVKLNEKPTKKTKKRGKGHLRYFSLSVDTADSFVEELLKRRYHNQYTTTSKCDIYRTIVQGRLKFLTISLCIKYKNTTEKLSDKHKKLNLLRGTARRAVSVETVRNVSN